MSKLPIWQKPEDFFKAPTYTIGGSDSSHTRQGGTKIILKMPATMVFMLLGIILYKNKGNNVSRSAEPDYFIDFYNKNTLLPRGCLTPKALLNP